MVTKILLTILAFIFLVFVVVVELMRILDYKKRKAKQNSLDENTQKGEKPNSG